ncbi:uncharacterized protein LOC110445471 [Mizuhopecten yessoensis]|uniref:Uncharacterized protein n=1 Tax=Mizuhopecten yessoensis TaxID=6573 RepID=A0A210QZH6_MIZYE|nr:uncharacterized protein LOC110445471 [Mizuhopecten yessoensis]OWF54163.1 hypothetical protein KP79_PYT18909 [Mizuhopecten yessoensis]
MKDLFFIILVVFSSWTFISGAMVTQSGRRNFQTSTRKNDSKVRSARLPAVSFSAGPAKSKCESQKCNPGYKKKVTANPTGGCPIVNCIRKQQAYCPPVNCQSNQKKSYSGKKLPNGCQEIKCVNNRQPQRAQRRRKGGCPSVRMCTPREEGYCEIPRIIYVNRQKCYLCPDVVKCNKRKCPDISLCPSANFQLDECLIPRKDKGGCKQCPEITKNCDQIGGVRKQLV